MMRKNQRKSRKRRKVTAKNDVFSRDVGRRFDRFPVGIVDFLRLKGVGLIGN